MGDPKDFEAKNNQFGPPTRHLVNTTVNGFISQHNRSVNTLFKGRKGLKGAPKNELELALTVLLVDIASADQHFDACEYTKIELGLRRVFGTTKNEVVPLVNQAKQVMANMRGTSTFTTLLRENLTDELKHTVFEVIGDVIDADGVQDGFEIYLREKFAEALGLKRA